MNSIQHLHHAGTYLNDTEGNKSENNKNVVLEMTE
jgi:hypothetical protein